MVWSIKEAQVEGIPASDKSKFFIVIKYDRATYATSKRDASELSWNLDFPLSSPETDDPDDLVLIQIVRYRKYLVCFKKKELFGSSLERVSDLVKRSEQDGTNTIRLEMNSVSVTQMTLMIKLANTRAVESTLPISSPETAPLASTTPQVSYGFHDQDEA